MQKYLLTITSGLLLIHFSYAQNLVRGKIIDGKTGEVMVGATVVIKGTTEGSVTDYDGLFEFTTKQNYPYLKHTLTNVTTLNV